ncbi:MAG: ATPase, T2SS/T4P/T4SS family [Verrucomicrobiae bacterium]|nr:ATPase, T2SS/T4P/T4SS family [Verrucomicrobiae bacterium]
MSIEAIPNAWRQELARRLTVVLGRRVDASFEGAQESDILAALGMEFRAPFVELAEVAPDGELMNAFGEGELATHSFVPVWRRENTLFCATSRPWLPHIGDRCKQVFGQDIEISLLLVTERDLNAFLNRHHLGSQADYQSKAAAVAADGGEIAADKVRLDTEGDTAWAVLSRLFIDAINKGATDLHLQPEDGRVRVRAEIHGLLQDLDPLPRELARKYEFAIYNHSGSAMKEDNRMSPQHGNISFDYQGRPIDLRVATVPAFQPSGEFLTHITIRFQDSQRNQDVELATLGFPEETLSHIIRCIESPGALCIVAGPTGSGKTTTLGACLKHLNQPSRMIYSVEDPVENYYPGVVHLMVRDGPLGRSFGEYGRDLLRKKPHVMLFGEIRDAETGRAVIEAATTGHIVLTTIHVDHAHEIPERLDQLGIPPLKAAQKLRLCSSQRLIKRLCHYCAESFVCSPSDAAAWRLPESFVGRPLKRRFPQGCAKCRGGYTGRKAIIEIIRLNDEIRRAISRGLSSLDLRDIVTARSGFKSLRALALETMEQQETDYEGVADVLELQEKADGPKTEGAGRLTSF